MDQQTLLDETLQTEVPVIEAEAVRQVRTLSSLGWGSKRIALELQISRNTVRRYTREPKFEAGAQSRPAGRRLGSSCVAKATQLWAGEAEGNAVVVHRLLQADGHQCAVRTVQRAVASERAKKRRADIATVRYEAEPGAQMQIDSGEKLISIGGATVKIYLFVAVLGFSRRVYVQATLSQRQEDWQEGVAAAFSHFGGSTRTLLIDNPKAIVLENKAAPEGGRSATLHPSFASFLRD